MASKILDIIQKEVEKEKCPKCGKPIVAVCRPKTHLKHRGKGHCEADSYERGDACQCNDRNFEFKDMLTILEGDLTDEQIEELSQALIALKQRHEIIIRNKKLQSFKNKITSENWTFYIYYDDQENLPYLGIGHEKEGYLDDGWHTEEDQELMELITDHHLIGCECMESTFDIEEKDVARIKEYLSDLGFKQGKLKHSI